MVYLETFHREKLKNLALEFWFLEEDAVFFFYLILCVAKFSCEMM